MYRSASIPFSFVTFLAKFFNQLYEGQCPNAIDTVITYPNTENLTVPHVYNTLISCPNVASLNLGIKQGGCVVSLDDPWSFNFRSGDVFPPLRELHTTNYDYDEPAYTFFERAWHYAARKMGFHIGLERVGSVSGLTNLDLWMDAMDWTQLEVLNLINPKPGALKKLNRTIVPSVKDIGLTYQGTRSEAWDGRSNLTTTFITDLTSQSANDDQGDNRSRLESISLVNALHPDSATSIMDLHVLSAVKSFELRTYESHTPDESRPTMDISSLSQLRLSSPHLQNLSIDVDRNGTWPYDILEELSKFEALESLHIWVELASDCRRKHLYNYWEIDAECSGDKQFRQPMVSVESASELFDYIGKNKKGRPLKNLKLIAGDLGRDYGGGLRLHSWLEGKAYSVQL